MVSCKIICSIFCYRNCSIKHLLCGFLHIIYQFNFIWSRNSFRDVSESSRKFIFIFILITDIVFSSNPHVKHKIKMSGLGEGQYVPLDMKGCICHFLKWQIHPFISKGTKNLFLVGTPSARDWSLKLDNEWTFWLHESSWVTINSRCL